MDVEIPRIGKSRLLELYIVWFIVVSITSGFAWREVEAYNPEGSGLFNPAEASLLCSAWLKVSAALLSGIFTSIVFGVGVIARRIRLLAETNRAGNLAIIEELRRNSVSR